MLKLMREKAQSWMIKVMFGIIIIVFVFFYGYGRKSGERKVVAEVNGTKIMEGVFRSEYQKAYENLARLYQSIYKDRFDAGMIDRLALGDRVLNTLIDQTLMVQEAEKLSLQVSAQELQSAIHSMPVFQEDGKFNPERFSAILAANQVSADEFEEAEKRSRLITKLTDLISLGGVDLSDQEILEAFTLENEKINLQYVRFNPPDYEKSISVDDSELEAYFASNSARFETPPRVRAQYLVFAVEDFLKTASVNPEEIQEEYEYRRDEFRVPKRIKVSHILIKGEGDNGEKSLEEAREKAEGILDEARGGGDFAALAQEHSEDPDSAKKGGSIGWVRQGEGVPELVEVAFTLKEGEIGPIVESDEGLHIVKVDDVEEERVKSLKEVEGALRTELTRAKSRQLAEDEAQQAFFATYESRDLEGYARETGRALKTTPLFSRNERIEEVKGNLEFNSLAFSLQEDEASSPLEIGGDHYLIQVIDRENSRIPEFEEVKDKVRDEVLKEKAADKAESEAEELVKAIKAGKSMAESAVARGLKVEETGLFERGGGYVPRVGPIQALGEEIFSVSPESPLLEKVVSYGKVFFVMELKEEQKIDMEEFESEKEQFKRRLYAAKGEQVVRQWLDSLRKNSEIKIREENLPF